MNVLIPMGWVNGKAVFRRTILKIIYCDPQSNYWVSFPIVCTGKQ